MGIIKTGILKRKILLLYLLIFILPHCLVTAQETSLKDSSNVYTLEQCISYALENYPGINQTLLNSEIAKANNIINLSGWMPQINLTGNVTHFVQLPTTLSTAQDGSTIAARTGLINTVIPQISISQTIFDPQLLASANKAPLFTKQAEQKTDSARIFVITNVSKTFYSLLRTFEQIKILKEDTTRLAKTVNDTKEKYIGGIVDKTDFEQAVITLNNSKAELRLQTESVGPGYALLKQIMGLSPEKKMVVAFDTLKMMKEIECDTTQVLQYERRIEYKQLQTLKELAHQQTVYNRLSFLPTVSVFYNYYHEFESNSSSNLFSTVYPYSNFGLSFSLPIFKGFSRLENLNKSVLQENIMDWSEISLRSQIYSEYKTALANYKSNLYNWNLMNENRSRARNVYRIVYLQYKQGIVAYLNLIVAESNLITSEIGYVDSLFQLLSSKIDLEKALGVTPLNSKLN